MGQQSLKGLDDLPVFESEPYMVEVRRHESVRRQVPIHELAIIITKPISLVDEICKRYLLVGVVGRDPDSTKIYFNSLPLEREDGKLVGSLTDYNYILVNGIESYEIIPSHNLQEQPLERRI